MLLFLVKQVALFYANTSAEVPAYLPKAGEMEDSDGAHSISEKLKSENIDERKKVASFLQL